jgi:hypothetical protein
MGDPKPSEREAAAIDDEMVRRIEQRRLERQERRRQSQPVDVERRQVCSFCFQRGDHRTAADCLRALERRSD